MIHLCLPFVTRTIVCIVFILFWQKNYICICGFLDDATQMRNYKCNGPVYAMQAAKLWMGEWGQEAVVFSEDKKDDPVPNWGTDAKGVVDGHCGIFTGERHPLISKSIYENLLDGKCCHGKIGANAKQTCQKWEGQLLHDWLNSHEGRD